MTTTTAAVREHVDEYPIAKIHVHPHNPRRNAKADDELVASIRSVGLLQDLVVAPHPDLPDEAILVAGHRRLDGLKKAKRTTAPVTMRRDLILEGQQLEAALVENGRRKDLSPIEEADCYHQLTLLDYKAKDIAAAVGVNVAVVNQRLKLRGLQASTQQKIHEGQVTIDDALTMAKHTDDPAAVARLEKAIGTTMWPYEVESVKRDRAARDRTRKEIRDLTAAGTPRYDLPDGTTQLWEARDRGDVQILTMTFSADPADHPGCVAFYPDLPHHRVHLLCTDPAKHADQLDDTELERREAHAARMAEADARAYAEATAAAVRRAVALEVAKPGIKMSRPLADILRALLPTLLVAIDDGARVTAYQDAMGIPETRRWPAYPHARKKADDAAIALHVAELAQARDHYLAKALIVILTGLAEQCVGMAPGANYPVTAGARSVAPYFDWLTANGHHLTDVDREHLAAATGGDR